MDKRFSAKVLLFGEYVILNGGMGLAFPYGKYYGTLETPNDETILSHEQLDSNAEIKKLAVFLMHNPEFKQKKQINQFLEDALLGLFFNSNIPKNYGLGSSGALVASIYSNYFIEKDFDKTSHLHLKKVKSEMATMESVFHGESSGIDPFVSFVSTPILLNAPIHTSNVEQAIDFQILLIDTGKTSSTANFVEIYKTRCNENADGFNKLVHLNNEAIKSLFGDTENAFYNIQQLCSFEYEFIPEMFMVPGSINSLIDQNNSGLCGKICGSGGGGFYLLFVKKELVEIVTNTLKKECIPYDFFDVNTSNLIQI